MFNNNSLSKTLGANIAIYISLIVSLTIVKLVYTFMPATVDVSYLKSVFLDSAVGGNENAENFAYLSFIISFPITYLIAIYFLSKKFIFNDTEIWLQRLWRSVNILNIVIIIAVFLYTTVSKSARAVPSYEYFKVALNLFQTTHINILFYIASTIIMFAILIYIYQDF